MKKILLTSTYMLFLRKNSNLLSKRGFEVFTTSNGGEAFKLHQEHKFDLIFSDFRLEDMGGCTLCSLIRKKDNSHHVPIVIACHNFPGSIESVEQCGASAMLIKPVETIKLIETLGGFLDLEVGRSKRVVLNVEVIAKNGAKEFSCFSHDISNTGILIETEQLLDIGSRLICKFDLPGFCQIETEGEITRRIISLEGGYLFGIKFVALPLSSRKAIDSYIESLLVPEVSNINVTSSVYQNAPIN